MNPSAVASLCCPFCLGTVNITLELSRSACGIEYGVLECVGCRFEFPVVGGVLLVLGPDDGVDVKAETRASTLVTGPKVGEIVGWIKAGRPAMALGQLLGPTGDEGRLFPQLPTPGRFANEDGSGWHHGLRKSGLSLKRGGRLVSPVRHYVRRLLLPHARKRLAEFLTAHADNLSALDVVRLYYGDYSGAENVNYFTFRFGQPRHLAALGLASLLHHTTGPILDLACGMGHLTHYFAHAFVARPVFGVDRDFVRLYIARRYIAPTATFVCAPADQALPFRAGSLGGIFCSDAFHYFLNRAACVREGFRLLAPDGVLVLSRFGNREVTPNEGYELSPEGYERLFVDRPHVLLGEEALIGRYLLRLGPDLRAASPTALSGEKWLSLVAAPNLKGLQSETPFDVWPHAAGRLQVNPIYVSHPSPDGEGRDLVFRFPSSWYEFENRRYQEYAVPLCHLTAADLRALESGDVSSRIRDLIDSFVVVGMPDAYLYAT